MLNLDKNKHYLLACSGGPDSMALFNMLINEGYKFSVALVNYHLREESNQEEEMVKEYSSKYGVTFYSLTVEERIGSSNVEKKCRDIRYRFFVELVNKYRFDAVLVAQHQDDLIETFLLQKRRKNLVLFYGIKEKGQYQGVEIIRPLLGKTKGELLDYCNKNNIPYAIDKTNLEDTYLRNKIRHQIVEKMSLEERNNVLKEIEDNNIELQSVLDRLLMIDKKDYCSLTDKDLCYALVMMGRKLKDDFKISKRQVLELRKIMASDKANISLRVDGLIFYKEYNDFGFRRVESGSAYSLKLEKPGTMDTEFFFLDFNGDTSNRNVSPSDYPLTIRTGKPSDVYQIKSYKKTLRRLFIDWKMPAYLRKRWPVIENKDGIIVYVPRYQKDFLISPDCNFYVKY